jgi:DNA mismatch repair protein MLH1
MLGLECEEAGWTESAGDKKELAKLAQELLLEKADMLRQYFSIYIDKKGYLKSLPILLGKFIENLQIYNIFINYRFMIIM